MFLTSLLDRKRTLLILAVHDKEEQKRKNNSRYYLDITPDQRTGYRDRIDVEDLIVLYPNKWVEKIFETRKNHLYSTKNLCFDL